MRSFRRRRRTVVRLARARLCRHSPVGLRRRRCPVRDGAERRGERAARASTSTTSWTVYHGNALGSGIDFSGVSFSPPNARVDIADPRRPALRRTARVRVGGCYAATENNTIYALAANSGSVLWSTNVGTAVPASDLPCGDVTPEVGITGTPVIDQARR